MQKVVVTNTTKAAVIGEISVADSSLTRFLGLMGRKGLPAGEGLWIKPSSGVHTMWMRFTIDVVALVELAPGAIGQLGIEVGDQFEMAA
jgi:uncharacterized membrane protein (UPF0127 family)